MSPILRILAPGARSLLQDRGFVGGRGTGIPSAGALDQDGLCLLNALLGNPPDAPAIEIALTPPRLRAEGGAIRLAIGAGLTGSVVRPDGDARALGPWTAATLQDGDELRLQASGPCPAALIGIAGALDLPRFLGSHSTLPRARLGGIDGRALKQGDALVLRAAAADPGDLGFATPPADADGPIRVVPGPQAEWFTEAAQAALLSQEFRVTAETDRMGMRLDGPVLAHSERGADIISDGIAPGAIQVPGSGKPIVLLADAQTTGGYPKIATVIGADLSRFARLAPGDTLRFAAVTVDQAEDAARARRAELDRIAAAIQPARSGEIDLRRLYQANLIGGAVDSIRPDHFPLHLGD